MSLLNHLSSEIPHFNRSSIYSPLYKITERYFDEIIEAKSKGYSWIQIINAVKADQGESWKEGWKGWDLAKHFSIIKKSRQQ